MQVLYNRSFFGKKDIQGQILGKLGFMGYYLDSKEQVYFSGEYDFMTQCCHFL